MHSPILYRVETQTADRARAGKSPFVDWYTAESQVDAERQAAYDAEANGLESPMFSIRPATQAEIDA